ncbi:MAG: hypothetical protein KC505_05815 [Myxococcales bacterium]|nr:hypothetical protein [Myxococcales bacterium]USN49821.1 MAG: hypothetical protein H6731_05955 [Myxococcales bacterium]
MFAARPKKRIKRTKPRRKNTKSPRGMLLSLFLMMTALVVLYWARERISNTLSNIVTNDLGRQDSDARRSYKPVEGEEGPSEEPIDTGSLNKTEESPYSRDDMDYLDKVIRENK